MLGSGEQIVLDFAIAFSSLALTGKKLRFQFAHRVTYDSQRNDRTQLPVVPGVRDGARAAFRKRHRKLFCRSVQFVASLDGRTLLVPMLIQVPEQPKDLKMASFQVEMLA